MKKVTSLKLNKEFKRAYFQGRFKSHPLLVTYMVKNKQRENRIGITTSKKIGCAVHRNRARRIIKQAFHEILEENKIKITGYDLVFVARSETPKATTKKVKEVMFKQINFLISQAVSSKDKQHTNREAVKHK